MDNLIMKEVCFKNKKIRAIEENGKIYVAVKDICNNLGMNGDHYRNQKKKIQKDELLKGGSKLTPLNQMAEYRKLCYWNLITCQFGWQK